MRSVLVHSHGGPEVLTLSEGDPPEPAPHEVLVQVAASGVNFIDIYQRSGAYPMDLPYVVGSEGAGTVITLGAGVGYTAEQDAALSVGDRVAWASVPGTGATEYAAVPAARTVPVPDGVELSQAAAVMLQGMTAHYLCESTFAAVRGQVALVHAAAGGVGLLLSQMLSRKGVRVIGTTSSDAKADAARGAGVTDVVQYRRVDADSVASGSTPDWVGAVTDLVGEHAVHVVYDGVGKDTFDGGIELLRPRGTMVLFGAASGPVPPFDPQRLNSAGSIFLTRPNLGHYLRDREELLWRAGDVLEAVRRGDLDVRIGGTYPLEELARAHEDLASGATSGKLLIRP